MSHWEQRPRKWSTLLEDLHRDDISTESWRIVIGAAVGIWSYGRKLKNYFKKRKSAYCPIFTLQSRYVIQKREKEKSVQRNRICIGECLIPTASRKYRVYTWLFTQIIIIVNNIKETMIAVQVADSVSKIYWLTEFRIQVSNPSGSRSSNSVSYNYDRYDDHGYTGSDQTYIVSKKIIVSSYYIHCLGDGRGERCLNFVLDDRKFLKT